MNFDEPNLAPCAGLLPAAVLAQRIGLSELVEERLTLARHGANSGVKALTVIGSMLAGGDSIDDTALLRAGALPQLFNATRAPSTNGTWLRDFKWHNVRQLDAISRELLTRQWVAGDGPADLSAPMMLDVDSTIVPVFGRGKRGAAFGYTIVPVFGRGKQGAAFGYTIRRSASSSSAATQPSRRTRSCSDWRAWTVATCTAPRPGSSSTSRHARQLGEPISGELRDERIDDDDGEQEGEDAQCPQPGSGPRGERGPRHRAGGVGHQLGAFEELDELVVRLGLSHQAARVEIGRFLVGAGVHGEAGTRWTAWRKESIP
ncbi:MAG: hypothetical protein ACR2LF_01940 [Jatrophihabitantaceae bacterium]